MIKILELDKRIGSSLWTANFRYFDWLGLASIGANIGSSIIGGLASNKMSKEQLEKQEELFHWNWAYQRGENQRAFQRSADFEREMFDTENLYNSPIELLKRFEAAGINPQVALNGSLGSASSQSASAGNAVSPAGAPGGIPQVPRESSPFETISASMKTALPELFSLLKTKADIDNTRADTEKKGAETEGQKQENEIRDRTMDSFIDSLIAKYNLSTELDTLRASFAIQTVNNEQQLLKNQLEEVATRALKNASEGDLADAQKELTEVEKLFTQDKYNFFQQQKPWLLKDLEESVNLLIEKQETENSTQALNRSMQYSYDELAKKTSAEKWSIIENSITLYEDKFGVKMSKSKREEVKKELFKQMQEHTKQEEKKTRQMGQDYWNPFKYIGGVFGGSGSVNVVKAIK